MGNKRRLAVSLVLALAGICISFGKVQAASVTYSGQVLDGNFTPATPFSALSVLIQAWCSDGTIGDPNNPPTLLAGVKNGVQGNFSITFDVSGCSPNNQVLITFQRLAPLGTLHGASGNAYTVSGNKNIGAQTVPPGYGAEAAAPRGAAASGGSPQSSEAPCGCPAVPCCSSYYYCCPCWRRCCGCRCR